MAGTEHLVADVEVHFAVPPSFAASWLTDFRPDDGKRWFDFRDEATVSRTSTGFRIETTMSIGRSSNEVTIESPTHWTSRGQFFNRKGKPFHVTRLDETVAPDNGGTRHRLQMWVTPQTVRARISLLYGRRFAVQSLREGFSRMKEAMEREYSQSTQTA